MVRSLSCLHASSGLRSQSTVSPVKVGDSKEVQKRRRGNTGKDKYEMHPDTDLTDEETLAMAVREGHTSIFGPELRAALGEEGK